MKFCKKCQKETQRYSDNRCKECANKNSAANYLLNKEKYLARSKAYRIANKEKMKDAKKAYRQRNKQHHNAYNSEWRAKNLEIARALTAAWDKANPEKRRAIANNRRAAIAKSGGKHTASDLLELMKLQKHKCACCKVDITDSYHVDHIIPIASGGSNDKLNLQLLCPLCNRSKGDKHPVDFMQSRGYLL